MLSIRKKKFLALFLNLAVLLMLSPISAAADIAYQPGKNVRVQDGTVYLITLGGQKRPYTSAGAFLSYGFNSWGGVNIASAEDLSLPTGNFIPPRDGKVFCSDRGADKGTCYLITGSQKAGFVSESVFKALGFSFSNAISGDVSWLPSAANIESSSAAHLPGVLINNSGTVYIASENGLTGIPSMQTLTAWGYALEDVVAANAQDQAETQTGVLASFVPGSVAVVVDPVIPISTGDITVISPNGGEQLPYGSAQTIRWSAPSAISEVSISLLTWFPACDPAALPLGEVCAAFATPPPETYAITSGTANDGSFEWVLPANYSAFGFNSSMGSYVIKVQAGQSSDSSDSGFSIVAASFALGSIKVTSPNGGQTWTRGSNVTVDYTSSNISKVDIRLATYVACLHQPSGPTCALAELAPYTVIENVSATGHFTFLLDKDIQGRIIPAGQYLVEVASVAGEPISEDRSDNFITIVGSSSASAIKVLSPNGGESWTIGTIQQIKWSAPSSISKVNIYLEWGPCGPTPSQACAGFSIDAITLVKGTVNDGSFDWVVGKDAQGKTINNDNYLVRVEEDPFSPNYIYDYSDSIFTVSGF